MRNIKFLYIPNGSNLPSFDNRMFHAYIVWVLIKTHLIIITPDILLNNNSLLRIPYSAFNRTTYNTDRPWMSYEIYFGAVNYYILSQSIMYTKSYFYH